ncbi:hypothetical protein ACRTDL_03255 [Shewanella algae]|uniref:hypothetical protein n=1 Tax=Shewanella algae TaxID=38313 RepID=UPI003D7E6E68
MGISKPSQDCVKHQKDLAVLYSREKDLAVLYSRGDEALTRLRGIVSFGVEVITRVHQWTLSQRETHKEYQAESTNRFSLECCQ